MTSSVHTAPPPPDASPTSSEPRKFRPDIEGLRAIAVLMVVLEHAGLSLLSGGYIGVDIFFVLSGFLITGLLIREVQKNGSISLAGFYARRARRLLPAASLVLLVTVVASFTWLGDARGSRVAVDAIWASLFASNFRSIEQGTDYLGSQLPPSPLQHYWSLAVEEQFYVIWPLLIIGATLVFTRISLRVRLGALLTAMIVISLAWSQWETAESATSAYFSPFPRASELAAGALLAVVAPALLKVPRRWGVLLSWAGLATILAVSVTYTTRTTFPGLAVIIPVLGTVALVAGGTIAPEGGAEVILKRKPFQWLGKLSYSLYLWHWPILVIAAGRAGRDLTLTENLLLCALAIVISMVTYVVVENPIRGWKALTKRAPQISIGFGAAMVVASVGATAFMAEINEVPPEQVVDVAQISELPSRDGVIRAVNDATLLSDWPEQPARLSNPAYQGDCNVTRADTTAALCAHGNPDAERTIVVLGDSHGAMWIPAFDEIGRRGDWRVIQLTKPGCITPDFPIYSSALGREYTECADFREFSMQQIEEINPDVVVITNARKGVQRSVDGKSTTDGVEEVWAEGLGSVIDRVSPHTDRVIVLGDMAYPTQGGIDCLSANTSDVMACSTAVEDAIYADHNAMEAAVAEEHGAQFIDTIPWFCTDSTCPAVIGDLTVRRDAHHVSENYAFWLSLTLGSEAGLLNADQMSSPSPDAASPESDAIRVPFPDIAFRREAA